MLLEFAFEREAVLEGDFGAGLDAALDAADGERGPARRGEAPGVGHGLLPERGGRVGLEDVVDEAEFRAALEVEELARGHQLNRARLADGAREALRPARAGQHAQTHLGQPHLARAPARDAEVGGERDLQPAADAVAVDGRDDELRRLLQARQRLVGVEAEVVFEGRRHLRQHRDVGARAEELLARAGDDDDVDGLVHPRAQDGRVELLHHLVRVGVRGRVVEREDGQPFGRLVADERARVGAWRSRRGLSFRFCHKSSDSVW